MSAPSKLTVLVVDDDPLVRKFLGALLKRLGYEPVLADGSAEGIEMLRARPEVAVAVVDMHMPVMDGVATLKGLRALAPGLTAVLLTGDASPQTAAQALAGGAHAVLSKPVQMDELRAAIDSATGSANGAMA